MNAVHWRWVETELIWASRRHWPQGKWEQYQPVLPAIIWLMVEGQLEVEMAGQRYELNPGDMCFQPPQMIRAIHARQTSIWHSVALRVVAPVNTNLLSDSPAIWNSEKEELMLILEAFKELEARQFSSVPADTLRVDGALRWLLGLSLGHIQCGGDKTESAYPMWLQTALTNIETQPQIDLGDLSCRIGYSPTQFRSRFRQIVGTSPRDYAQECLGRKARQYLIGTDWSIEHISDELGFSAPTHFARFFKRRFGLSPAQFRLRAAQ